MQTTTLKVKIGAGGKIRFNAPKQIWRGETDLQTALFAGHEMIAINDDQGGFILIFLDCESEAFTTIDAAKIAAPQFAQAVCQFLSSLIDLT
jgi:hypothetical protein